MKALNKLGEEYGSGLIKIDSPKIGKKVKISESFLEKYGNDIHDWLLDNQMPSTSYVASVMSVQQQQQQHNSGAQPYGNFLRLARNLYRKLYSRVF